MSLIGNIAKSALGNFLDNFDGSGGGDISVSIGSVTLPVAPEEFSVQVSNKNSTIDINNAGEYNMIGKTGLKSVSISSFFPAQEYYWVSDSPDAWGYVDKIEEMRTSEKAVTFKISGTSISFDCLIESFQYGVKDGSGDVYFTINLKEYRLPEVTPAKVDEKTGLKKRKMSFLQRAGVSMAKRMLRGESTLHAITGAIGDGGLSAKQHNYLDAFRAVTKQGGLKPGDIITVAAGQIAKNGTNIFGSKKKSVSKSSGSEGELV